MPWLFRAKQLVHNPPGAANLLQPRRGLAGALALRLLRGGEAALEAARLRRHRAARLRQLLLQLLSRVACKEVRRQVARLQSFHPVQLMLARGQTEQGNTQQQATTC